VTPDDVAQFEACVARGGVALFPADTVYGLAVDPESPLAVERLYALKGRRPDRPAAVMFFELERALAELPELGTRTRAALGRLLPGGLTLILPNHARRYPLACGPEPDRLGLRVPALSGRLEPLHAVHRPVLQSSANPTGGRDARRLEDVEASIRSEVDVTLDAGELPGVPSTVVDLAEYEASGRWEVVREGAVGRARLREAL
jgi:L-threonylcarbamoyladenylate synthase